MMFGWLVGVFWGVVVGGGEGELGQSPLSVPHRDNYNHCGPTKYTLLWPSLLLRLILCYCEDCSIV